MMKLTIFIVILIVATVAIHASVKHFAEIVNVSLEIMLKK